MIVAVFPKLKKENFANRNAPEDGAIACNLVNGIDAFVGVGCQQRERVFFRERKVTRVRFDTATMKEGYKRWYAKAWEEELISLDASLQLFNADQSIFTNAIERHVATQPRNVSAWPADVKPGTLRIRKLLAVLTPMS